MDHVPTNYHRERRLFSDWLDDNNWQLGQISFRENDGQADRRFVSRERLKSYFKVSNIQRILNSLHRGNLYADAEVVRKSFVQIFAILLWIGHVEDIDVFIEHHYTLSDRCLPFSDSEHPPRHFPSEAGSLQAYFTEFYKAQWRFWVPNFQYVPAETIPESAILPIIEKKALGTGNSGNTFLITIHDEYNNLSETQETNVTSKSNVYVVKEFYLYEGRSFHREVDAHLLMRRQRPQHNNLIEFFGSYTHGTSKNVLLEYADGGTLEDFFQLVQPPSQNLEIHHFWTSLLQVIHGLNSIHEVHSQVKDQTPLLQGWHQDVKPSNILICRTSGRSIFEFVPKLADLGLTHFSLAKDYATLGPDAHGTRSYGAPECFTDSSTSGQNWVTWSVDIWSLGAVFSESVTFTLGGWSLLDNFRNERIESPKKFQNLERCDCFHDGRKVLKCVHDHHEKLYKGVAEHDRVTRKILRMTHRMLGETPAARPSSGYLLHEASDKMKRAHEQMIQEPAPEKFIVQTSGAHFHVGSPPAIPDRARAKHTLSNAALEELPPVWSVVDALRDVRSGKTELVNETLREEIRQREVIILIDDSHTMANHWDFMLHILEILTSILCITDPTGVDQYYTVSHDSEKERRDKSLLVRRARDHRPSSLTWRGSNIKTRLTEILDNIREKLDPHTVIGKIRKFYGRKRAFTIYVLTDGMWLWGTDAATPIKSMVETLEEKHEKPNQVAIQFIQFGNDTLATKRLNDLDDAKELPRDIVDVEPADGGDVNKMILGAINRRFDNSNRADPASR